MQILNKYPLMTVLSEKVLKKTDRIRDDDKNGVSGLTCIDSGNHEKKLDYTENSTWATTEKNSNKTNIIHKSRFRITSVTGKGSRTGVRRRYQRNS